MLERLQPLEDRPQREIGSLAPHKLPYHKRLRGRAATHPLGIGLRGWWDIAQRVRERVGLDNLGLVTAGVTFYVFLALIPGLIAVVAFYGIVTDNVTLEIHVQILSGYLPEQTLAWIANEIGRIQGMRDEGLSLTFLIALVISFWSMNNAVIALFGAMNVAYGEVEKRGVVVLYAQAFAFTLASLVVGITLIACVVLLPLVNGDMVLGRGGRPAIGAGLAVLVALGSAAIFRLGPSRKPARWRWIAPGALAVAAGWVTVAWVLSWYLSNIANYTFMYGSLGTVFAFLFWLYISVYTLLLGAELNAEIEHQTMVDTTVGKPRPLGERGAYMADTIGKSDAD